MAGRAGRDNGIQSVTCLLESSSLKILKAILKIRDYFLITKIINFYDTLTSTRQHEHHFALHAQTAFLSILSFCMVISSLLF